MNAVVQNGPNHYLAASIASHDFPYNTIVLLGSPQILPDPMHEFPLQPTIVIINERHYGTF